MMISNYIAILLPALLIFVVVYALLSKTETFGKNKAFAAAVAIIAAFLGILFKDVLVIINFMAPWFVVIFIFLVLLLVLLMILGVKEETIAEFVSKNKGFQMLIIAIALIIFFAALGYVYGERLLPVTAEKAPVEAKAITTGEAGTFKENVFKVIFNTKVLGALFILIVAIFAIVLLTREKI
ncbi:hypothetical protein KY307_00030 [Candidatus Woesearchaeota archaeon]|nr:hypothetical protein [Candidatus Woesearchaeota archaeon]